MARTGSPIWIDLGTHDIDGSVSFYSQVFGWDVPEGSAEFGGYRIATKDGVPVGGMMSSLMGPDGPLEEPEYPTAWTVYLAVEDCAAAVAAAEKAGATVVVPAMEVGELGSMAILFDPAGAGVGFWEAKEFPGLAFNGQPGTPVWFEQMSKNFQAAADFYQEALGWNLAYMGEDGQPVDSPPTSGIRYATNGAGEEASAGLCEADSFLPAEVPSYWRAYIGVSDTDATAAQIVELGGAVLDGPMDSPFGRVATVADPQGGTFQIVSVEG